MPAINNAINNCILGIARFGTTISNPTTQAAITPSISSGNITTGLLINPIYTPSSGTFYGEQINPQFNLQGGNVTSAYGMYIAPTITPTGSGSVINAYGLNIAGPAASLGLIDNAVSLYIENSSCNETIVNKYTAVFGTNSSALVGIGTTTPAFHLDIAGFLSAHRVYHAGTTMNNQLIGLAQGADQGGFGGGSVGANKPVSLNTVAFYDLTTGGTKSIGGFSGGVFDGRYIYFVPYLNNGVNSTIARYDTVSSFGSAGSYSTFNLLQVSSLAQCFYGALFDGKYVYFIPLGPGIAPAFTRYNTTLGFGSINSYSVFNLTAVGVSLIGYAGGAFDGRYIYLAPARGGVGLSINSTIVRYDTTLSFNQTSSYSTFNTYQIDPTLTYFYGGIYDGRYVYFVPYLSGLTDYSGSVFQYDTSLPFSSSGSYTIFNLRTVATSCRGYQGAVFDGRYIYYFPMSSGAALPPLLTRFDTQQSFMNASSYTVFNLLLVDPSNQAQQIGGVYDGRYIYFGHSEYPPSLGATIIRFDTTQSFNSTNSYTCLRINDQINYRGAVFDGRYVYFAPSYSTPTNSSGTIVRLDAYPGPQATAMAASRAPNGIVAGSNAGLVQPPANGMLVGNTIAINATNPQGFNVYVNGVIHATSVIATNLTITPDNTSGGIYATGGTTRNQLITLAEGYDQGGFGGGSVGTNKTMSLNTTSFYDLTQGGTLPEAGYCGGVFDGRYIYYVPYINRAFHGTVVRYDTTLPFAAAGSYAIYDLQQLNSLDKGFWGGLYDGRYVYFIPFSNGANTFLTQYDTTYSFTSSAGYSIFDFSTIGVGPTGFAGGAFDGRYIYLSPAGPGGATSPNVTILRYDTTLPFIAASSYSTFNTALIDASGMQYFGAIFDGRYIYFPPWTDSTNNNSGSVARYDTTLPFSDAGSYALFNLTAIATSCRGFVGGVFDGRYIYYIPDSYPGTFINPPTFVRYDTLQSFAAVGSYTTFNLLLVDPTNIGQQAGAAFDGRYIYFGHDQVVSGVARGTIIRYDITQPFNLPGSYTCFCVNQNVTFKGPVYDGRYIYFPPADTSFGASGTIVRLDAYPGPQANAIAASQAPNGFVVGTNAGTSAAPIGSLIVGGRIGVDTLSPQNNVDIVGTMNAKNIIAPNLNLTQLYASAGTSNNQLAVLSQGYTQGGFGGGSVGTNKTISANSVTSFDITFGLPSLLYANAACDGRYIYVTPAGLNFSVVRYDTSLPFSASGSYTVFNLQQLSSNNMVVNGALFDGRYVYFLPNSNTWVIQYDTYQNFNLAGSYTAFDLSPFNGAGSAYGNGIFDGRYVYFCPFEYTTKLTRYDTTLPFTNPGSYTSADLSAFMLPPITQFFIGGTFDGRYVYLAPYGFPYGNGSPFLRYDTTLSFTASGSFTSFDISSFAGGSSALFDSAVFDGRYIYMTPISGATNLVRYDTWNDFNSSNSYQAFNLKQVVIGVGFHGQLFDGRYVYLIPWSQSAIVAYDTTKDFNLASSYFAFNIGGSRYGAVFDGRYIYCISTAWTRIDAYPGPQATSLAANQAPNGFMVGAYAGTGLANNTANSNAMVVSGNVGVGKASPQFLLDVNGTTDANTWSIASTLYGSTGLLTNIEYAAISQGYNEGGFGSGSVGTNKPLAAAEATIFDMTTVDTNSVGFFGVVFDGRYTYFVPGAGGPIAQLDTSLIINSANSYEMFYPASLNSLATGFAGGLFDGRYVYFVPLQNRRIVRYDTQQPFNTASSYFNAANSYTLFDLTRVSAAVPGYAGGAFDGRYLYFASNSDSNGNNSGTITRYDTILPFGAPASYTCFDTGGVSAGAAGYFGAAYDGRYVYFVPGSSSAGTISRYDTSLAFNAIGSWTLFDLTQLQSGCLGYYGAVFDGRFIYFTPYANAAGIFGTIVRYDTAQPFLSTNSYTLFDATQISPGCTGFGGAAYDGRYVYFSPAAASSGTVLRFDTTLTFGSIASYTTLDLSVFGLCQGYVGCTFDGQYVYFAPNQQGLLARINAYSGPQATAIAAGQAPNGFAVGTYAGSGLSNSTPAKGQTYYNALVVSGNVGVGLTTPTFSLHLAFDSAFKPTTNTWTINSDVRIKQDIQDITGALPTICQLRPRKFTYHTDYAKDILADPKETRYGFIADEVENILEGCVSPSSMHCYGGKMREWFDRGAIGDMPEPIHGLTNLKSFNMQNILIYTIQAIKELAEIQDVLQSKIDKLKNQN